MAKRGLAAAVLAVAGVVGTAVLAYKAGEDAYVLKMNFQKQRDVDIPKKASEENLEPEVVSEMLIASKKLEKEKLWRLYAPTVVTAVSTIAIIILGYRSSAKQLAAMSSYAALESTKLSKYRQKVREICPDGTDEKIIAELAKDDLKMYPALPEGKEDEKLFYDYFSGRFFRATPGRVREAVYHLNRNFALGWVVSPNDLYEMIGIEKVPFGSNLKWYADYMMELGLEAPWIDVSFQEDNVDGQDCIVMWYVWEPITEEEYEKELGD